jgi:hypothetical protein
MEPWILAAVLIAAALYATRALRRAWAAGQAEEGPGCDCPLAGRCRATRTGGDPACAAASGAVTRTPDAPAARGRG